MLDCRAKSPPAKQKNLFPENPPPPCLALPC
nr:MAG TPA: Lines C-terminus [Caudoviricetes sp.]